MPFSNADAYLPIHKRKVGMRPGGGSADILESVKDAYFPSAIPHRGLSDDHFPPIADDADMVERGYESMPPQDDELTGQ